MPSIAINVQARPRDREHWLALASRVEAAGFAALLVADHPGSGPSPWVALAAAATVTDRLRLGSYVVNAGVREPAHIAADAASLAVLAPGRVIVGLGAGHTPAEWAAVGRERPGPADRAARLVDCLDAVTRLLAGEEVTCTGPSIASSGARLADLPTGRDHYTVLVGGGHPLLLRAAAQHADMVALSGLGRTLADGHRHDVRWSRADVRSQLDLVSAAAAAVGRSPVRDALVQVVEVTDDRAGRLAELGAELGIDPDELAAAPYLLVGTREQLADQLLNRADELGITSVTVREPALDAIESVLPLL